MTNTEKRAASAADEAYIAAQEALPVPTAEMLLISAAEADKAHAKALRFQAWSDGKAAKKARRSSNSGGSKGGRAKGHENAD